MKSNFLRKTTKVLVFSIFVSGLPLDLQAAKAKTPVVKKLGVSATSAKTPVVEKLGASATPPAGTTSGSTTPGSTTGTTPPPASTQTGTCPEGWSFSAANCTNDYSNGNGGYSGASCNLNACLSGKPLSTNTPSFANPSNITADKTWSGPTTSPANDPIAQYGGIINNLLNAMGNYANVFAKFAMSTGAFNSLNNIVQNYFYTNPTPYDAVNAPSGYTVKPIPFSAGAISSTYVYPSGDFAPVITSSGAATNQKMALMWGFLQYVYASQASCSASDVQNWAVGNGNCQQMELLAAIVAVILYSALSTQPANFGAYSMATTIFSNQQWTQTCNNVTGACTNTPPPTRTPAEMVEYMNSPVMGGYKFKGGTLPSNILNLLIAISTADWSAVSQVDLENVISNTDWSQFNVTMANFSDDLIGAAWAQYILGSLQAINNGDIYFNCSRWIGTGLPISSEIYYAVNPQQANITLNDQYMADQAEVIALQKAAGVNTSSMTPTPLGMIGGVQTNFLPSTVNTSFNYMTGSFYQWLPGSTTQAVTNAVVDGAVSMSGLNGTAMDMYPGSLWATACANSSSSSVPQLQSDLLTLISEVSGIDNNATSVSSIPGSPVAAGNTVQGVAQNLLVAAQAAVNAEPVSSLASNPYADWVNAKYPTIQLMGEDGTPVAYQANNGSSVIPNVLSGFDTNFYTLDHQNMLMDLVQILSAYASCWQNVSDCGNQTPTHHLSITEELAKITGSPYFGIGSLVLFVAGIPLITHFWGKYQARKALKKAAVSSDTEAKAEDVGKVLPAPKDSVATPARAKEPAKINTGGGGGETIDTNTYDAYVQAEKGAMANKIQSLQEQNLMNDGSTKYNSLKAQIQADLAAATENSEDAAEAKGEAQAWNDAYPDDEVDIPDGF